MRSKIVVAILAALVVGGFAIVKYIIYAPIKAKRRRGSFDDVRIVTPIKAAPKKIAPPAPQPFKPKQEAPKNPSRPSPSADTIKAMHIQADAEWAIAEALERRAGKEPDPVKRARIERQVANSWVRFNKILDNVDRLTLQP